MDGSEPSAGTGSSNGSQQPHHALPHPVAGIILRIPSGKLDRRLQQALAGPHGCRSRLPQVDGTSGTARLICSHLLMEISYNIHISLLSYSDV